MYNENGHSGFITACTLLYLCIPTVTLLGIHGSLRFYTQAELQWTTESLRDQGEPVLPDDFNNKHVAAVENGVTELLAAAKAAELSKLEEKWFDSVTWERPLSEPNKLKARTFLVKRQPAFDAIDGAMSKEIDWGYELTSPMFMTLLPTLNTQRLLANELSAAAYYSHQSGDDRQAIHRVRQLFFQSKAVCQQPFLVSQLVAESIGAVACDVLQNITPTLKIGNGVDQVTQAELKTLTNELLVDTWRADNWRRAMQGERASQYDTAWFIISGIFDINSYISSKGEPVPIVGPLGGYLASPIILNDASELMSLTERASLAGARIDWPAAKREMPHFDIIRQNAAMWRFYLRMMLSTLDRAALTAFRHQTHRHLVAALLAIKCYSADHDGKLPNTLEALVPQYLPQVPSDPFARDGRIKFLPPKLYSVGENGSDDGGSQKSTGKSNGMWNQEDVVLSVK